MTRSSSLKPTPEDAQAAMRRLIPFVHYAHAIEVTDKQREAIPPELWNMGDVVLIWASEGELCMLGQLVGSDAAKSVSGRHPGQNESAATLALKLLVAAGHIPQAKVDEAMKLAAPLVVEPVSIQPSTICTAEAMKSVASPCSLGCLTECKAKQHGCASECPALPWQPEQRPVDVAQSSTLPRS